MIELKITSELIYHEMQLIVTEMHFIIVEMLCKRCYTDIFNFYNSICYIMILPVIL